MSHLLVAPREGRRPTTLQCAAGPLIELPVSVPSASSARFAATAAAPPPLDPVHTLIWYDIFPSQFYEEPDSASKSGSDRHAWLVIFGQHRKKQDKQLPAVVWSRS